MSGRFLFRWTSVVGVLIAVFVASGSSRRAHAMSIRAEDKRGWDETMADFLSTATLRDALDAVQLYKLNPQEARHVFSANLAPNKPTYMRLRAQQAIWQAFLYTKDPELLENAPAVCAITRSTSEPLALRRDTVNCCLQAFDTAETLQTASDLAAHDPNPEIQKAAAKAAKGAILESQARGWPDSYKRGKSDRAGFLRAMAFLRNPQGADRVLELCPLDSVRSEKVELRNYLYAIKGCTKPEGETIAFSLVGDSDNAVAFAALSFFERHPQDKLVRRWSRTPSETAFPPSPSSSP